MTYLFSGRLEHRDSLGNHQIIEPGDVNLMTAGKGITHSERTPLQDRKQQHQLFGIQCWLALPKEMEEMESGFSHYSVNALPLIDDIGLNARIVAGQYQGIKSPVKTVSETLLVDCRLDKNAVFNISAETEERAVYILRGKVIVDEIVYGHGQMLLLKPGHDINIVGCEASHILLLGGAVLDGERHVWWNFVSSSKERIEQAKRDWKQGKFAKIPGDDKEFIPLPE